MKDIENDTTYEEKLKKILIILSYKSSNSIKKKLVKIFRFFFNKTIKSSCFYNILNKLFEQKCAQQSKYALFLNLIEKKSLIPGTSLHELDLLKRDIVVNTIMELNEVIDLGEIEEAWASINSYIKIIEIRCTRDSLKEDFK